MATETTLNELTINYLTQEQYDAAKTAGTLNEDQVYMTPEEAVKGVAPAGGTTGQILSKTSSTDYDMRWIDNNILVVPISISGTTVTSGGADYTTVYDAACDGKEIILYNTAAGNNRGVYRLHDIDKSATKQQMYFYSYSCPLSTDSYYGKMLKVNKIIWTSSSFTVDNTGSTLYGVLMPTAGGKVLTSTTISSGNYDWEWDDRGAMVVTTTVLGSNASPSKNYNAALNAINNNTMVIVLVGSTTKDAYVYERKDANNVLYFRYYSHTNSANSTNTGIESKEFSWSSSGMSTASVVDIFGVPDGGKEGQVLTRGKSEYESTWVDAPSGSSSGMTATTIWTGSNANTTYAATNITFSETFTNFNYLIAYFRASGSAQIIQTVVIPSQVSVTSTQSYTTQTSYTTIVSYINQGTLRGSRTITLYSLGNTWVMKFEDAYNSSGTVDNTLLIPIRIIGYK